MLWRRRVMGWVVVLAAWWLMALVLFPPRVSSGAPGTPKATPSEQGEIDAGSLPTSSDRSALESANPLLPIPKAPLGVPRDLKKLDHPPTPQTVRLGRWLFFDTRLSVNNTISCASCHQPEHAYSELRPFSVGVHGKTGTRKAPSVVNLAWPMFPRFFWDGRAGSLEEQAVGPMANAVEMGNPDVQFVVKRIEQIRGYREYFKQAFGSNEITRDRIAKALADYQRTRMSGDSPWDRWRVKLDEGDEAALALFRPPISDYEDPAPLPTENPFRDGPHLRAQAKWGNALFHSKASCNQCHLGFNFTDSQFHNLGIGWDDKAQALRDMGRHTQTQRDEDKGAFKTPGLREVARRPPYFHDGSAPTLREAVEFYNRGGNKNPWLSNKIKPLNLTDPEIDAIVAFLESLNGRGFEDAAPTLFPQ